MDLDKQGSVFFDEFCQFCIEKTLDLDDDIDDEELDQNMINLKKN